MSVLTILLVAIFFAAWKAPRWVKEIGLFALVFGFLGHLLGVYQVLCVLRDVGFEQETSLLHIFVDFFQCGTIKDRCSKLKSEFVTCPTEHCLVNLTQVHT